MKVLLITECKYLDVPDSDSVKFVYYRPETNDYRIASICVELPWDVENRVAVFKPIVLGHMENGVQVEERFCVVPRCEPADKLVEIFEGVRKDAEELRRECLAWEKFHGVWMKKEYEYFHLSFWNRLKFLFGGYKWATEKFTHRETVK